MLHKISESQSEANNWAHALATGGGYIPARFRERRPHKMVDPGFVRTGPGWTREGTRDHRNEQRALGRWVNKILAPRPHEFEFLNLGLYVKADPYRAPSQQPRPPGDLHAPPWEMRAELAAAREQLKPSGASATGGPTALQSRAEIVAWSQPLRLELLAKTEAHYTPFAAACAGADVQALEAAYPALNLQALCLEAWRCPVRLPRPQRGQGQQNRTLGGSAAVAASGMQRQLERVAIVHGLSPLAAHVAAPGNHLEYLDLGSWHPRSCAAPRAPHAETAAHGALVAEPCAQPSFEAEFTQLLSEVRNEFRRFPELLTEHLAATQLAGTSPTDTATPAPESVPSEMASMAAQLEALRAQVAALEAQAAAKPAQEASAAAATVTATATTGTAQASAPSPAPARGAGAADNARPAATATATVDVPAVGARFNRRRDEALLSRWLPEPVARVASRPPWAYLADAGRDPSWRNLLLAPPMTVLSVALHVLDALAAIIAYFHSNGMFALLNIALTIYLRTLRVV